jgi:hypothetical protein
VKPIIVLVALVLGVGSADAKVKKPLLHERELEPETAAASLFNPDDVVRQIRARMGGVRACYERASRFDPGLRGKLQLGFDIADSGQVAATQVEVNGLRVDADASVANALTACIRTQAINWRLSPEGPAGGAHVSYVFVFEAAH